MRQAPFSLCSTYASLLDFAIGVRSQAVGRLNASVIERWTDRGGQRRTERASEQENEREAIALWPSVFP